MADIALAYDVDAHLVRRWIRQSKGAVQVSKTPVMQTPQQCAPLNGFMPVQVGQPVTVASIPDIRIECRQGSAIVNLTWPIQAASDCAMWLTEWLK